MNQNSIALFRIAIERVAMQVSPVRQNFGLVPLNPTHEKDTE